MRAWDRRWTGILLCVALAVAMLALGTGPVASADSGSTSNAAQGAIGSPEATVPYTEPAVTVELTVRGHATVTIRSTYDLEDDADEAAFAELQDDKEAREALEAQFSDRMTVVAEAINDSTARNVSLSRSSISIETVDRTGVVRMQVGFRNLAATQDNQLVLTEPFASGFEQTRPVVVVLPEKFAPVEATTRPREVDDGRLVWSPETSLEGFELVVEKGAERSPDFARSGGSEGNSLPGFGPLVAVLSLCATAVGLRARTNG